MRFVSFLALLFIVSCSNTPAPVVSVQQQNPFKQIDSLTAIGQYSTALSFLTLEGQREDRDNDLIITKFEAILAGVKASTEPNSVLEKDVHLAFASWLEYFGISMAKPETMRQNMPRSLRHYRRVIQIEPDNDKALSEIQQIEGIYRQMGRPVPEGVAE